MEKIDKIYIINLKHRTDRWSKCIEQLNRYNITNFTRFNAIIPDLNKIDAIHYSKNNLRLNTNYIIGSLGCKLSHLNIIKHAKQNKFTQILILEDDFLLTDNFVTKFNTIIECINNNNIVIDMLYLGFSIVRNNPYFDTNIKNFKKLNNCHTTHAYLLNSSFFDTIIREIETCHCEIDVCYVKLQKTKANIYGIYPCLITQEESYSNILNKKISYKGKINFDK
jgi:glycosyl transferase family 25